jgi:IS605 OrfB family transposase
VADRGRGEAQQGFHKFASRRLPPSGGSLLDATLLYYRTVSVYNEGVKLTVQIKLLPSAEQATHLLNTMRAVNAAATEAAQVGFQHEVFGQVSIHRLCYQQLRQQFDLPAQHAVRAIAKAVGCFSRDKTICPVFDPTGAIALDNRLYRLINLNTASINTIHGRIKIPFVLGDYFKGMLGHKAGEADLVYRDGQFYLYVTVEFPEEPPVEPTDWLGVDLGIVNLATDSTGEAHTGETVQRNRRRRATARKQYQRKGTKNAKRRLKKMAGRQARFQTHVNHTIAKTLVAKAKGTNAGIALEDLKGIRERLQDTVGRRFRRQLGNWSFHQLRSFIQYKAQRAGVPVVAVDPRNSSRTCSQCGHCEKANRPNQATFRCKQCGHSTNADQNAAINLAQRGKIAWAARKSASKDAAPC